MRKANLDGPREKAFLKAYADGKNDGDAAATLGIPRTTFSSWRHRRGYKAKHPRGRPTIGGKNRFTVLMTPEQVEGLAATAEERAVSRSAVIRGLIDEFCCGNASEVDVASGGNGTDAA